jgi:hypothetical protein
MQLNNSDEGSQPPQEQSTKKTSPVKLNQTELKDRRRKLNAIHSRQKRERRRIKCEQLRVEQVALCAEAKRLETLDITDRSAKPWEH